MNTGFVGTPHLLHALSESGYTDIAYNLLFQENFPSWLYSVNRGATTMWEHWDSIKEDGANARNDMNGKQQYLIEIREKVAHIVLEEKNKKCKIAHNPLAWNKPSSI